jgi:multiple sugar transport system substrate-binding protein
MGKFANGGRVIGLVILIVALLLSACKSDDGDETPGASPMPETVEAPQVEVERTIVLFAVYDWEQSLYDDLIQVFEEANPDLRVRLVSINEVLELDPTGGAWPDDAWQRLVSAADVVNMTIGQPGLARDLTPFIKADPTFQPDDFYPGVLESFQWEGGAWALPLTVDFELIFFDKDAFDEAGESYPEPGWTWDDLLAKAKALTVREGDEVIRWGFVQPWPSHVPFIKGRVGPLSDWSTDPPTPHFDRPEVVEAVRWYTDLYLKEQVTPYLEPPEPDEEGRVTVVEGQNLIDDGQAAMWRESSGSWEWRKQQYNLGVVPFPVDAPDSRTSFFWAQGLSMSAGTAHPDAAWRWMDFLSRQPGQSLGSFELSLPARRSVAQVSGFWDEIDEEFASVLRYAVDHSYTREWGGGYGKFTDAIEAILAGEESVEDALAEAQKQAQASLQEEAAQQVEATPMPTIVVVAPPEQEPAPEGAVSITFIPGLGSFDLKPFRDAAQQFQEAHPDVVVEIKPPDFSGGSLDMQELAARADCFQWFPNFQDPQNLAAVLSLEPFLDADPLFDRDDFFPSLVEPFTRQGQLWGLPSEVDPYVIEYNEDLFDAAGLDYPALDWTADDFVTLAAALTQGQDESKQYGFVAQTYEAGDLFMMMDRLGADLINEHEDPPALALDDPTVVEAVRWYVNLSALHGVKPVFVTDISELMGNSSAYMEREGLIAEGRAAMWTNSARMVAMDSPRPLQTGVVPLPVKAGNEGNGSWSSVTGYYISAHTQARQACWEWITFLSTSPEVVQGLPARRSVAASEAYHQRVGAERATAYLLSIAAGERPSIYQTFSQAGDWLGAAVYWIGQAYDQVIEGEASVEQALEAAQEIADDYRACIITRDAFSDSDEWQACMKEADPSIPDFLFGEE